MEKQYISPITVGRLMSQYSSHKVANDAKDYLAALLDKEGKQIARRASQIAANSGRKTVNAQDVTLALQGL